MGRNAKELRCFCRRKPLLATYGLDDQGERYIHVKVYKQKRIFCNIVVKGGEVKMQCRECLRWHKVRIVHNRPVLTESTPSEPAHAVG